jgi:hypothetical protein
MTANLGLTNNRVAYLLVCLRRAKGVTSLKKRISIQPSTVIQDYLIKEGMIRSSNREGAACELIIELLNNLYPGIKIPRHGEGLLIGTPTPLCASEHQNNGKTIDDNLEVFWALKWSTKSPVTIVIGDAKDPIKAHKKANMFRSHSSVPSRTRILVGRVDKNTFVQHTRELLNRNECDRPIKVVLLTSGAWANSDHNGIDCNYQSIAIPLTREHKNLYILAMTREGKGHGFDVRYIHRGEEIITFAGKEISNIDKRCEVQGEIRTYSKGV